MRRREVLAGLIAVALVMVPLLAEAAPITLEWGSFSADGLTTFGVYQSDDTTILPQGALAQLIWVGPNGVIDYPQCDGTPGGDDQLLSVSAVKNNYIPASLKNKGYIPLTAVSPGIDDADPRVGKLVYIRAWNGAPAAGKDFGNSVTAPLTASGYFNAPRWHMTRTCSPTAVLWSAFDAQAVGATVLVTWETTSELDIAGFNVFRSASADGQYAKLNAALIPATGGPAQGAAYSYEDSNVTAGGTYYYKIEAVSTGGQITVNGPISVRLGGGLKLFLPLLYR